MLRDRDVLVIGILWVVASLAAELLVAWLIGQWPLVASEQGQVTADAFFYLLRVGIVAFVLVVLVVAYSAIRFRVPADDLTPARVQVRMHRPFAWSWLGLSAALNVLFIVNPGITGVERLFQLDRQAQAADPLVVNVTAQQWSWHFGYPQYGLADVGELVLPVNRPVKFVITSSDVIHSFWVPAFGLKKDAIPGETRVQYLTPTVLTSTNQDPTARVQCAELCGVGHPLMRAALRVVTADEFTAWVAQQTTATPMPSGMQMGSEAPMESGMPMGSATPMPSGMQMGSEAPMESGMVMASPSP